MSLTETLKTCSSQIKTAPPKVLFVGKRSISEELREYLDENGLSWACISPDHLKTFIHNRQYPGTALIDFSSIPTSELASFEELLENLDRQNTALICYRCPAAVTLEHVPLAVKIDSLDFEELWARIETNLRFHQRLQETRSQHENHPSRSQLNQDTAQQLEMAGRVQRNFLPSKLPNCSKLRWAAMFHPAEWVSGDIYDITRLDEEHIGFYLADAVGHSMPAALLTMFLKQAAVMRQTIGNKYYIFKPWEVIKSLNLHMARQELSGCLFATCFYGLLNKETLTLKYARAGHPYPVLIRNHELLQLQTRGGLLGVFAEAEFEQQEIQLQPGDKLFIYSDGGEPFIGDGNADGTLTFTDAFREIARFPIEEMMQAYSEMSEHHHFKPGQIDDVTAIGLEIL